MKRIIVVTAIAAFFALGLAAPAFANDPHSPANPSGPATGQPNQTCQNFSAGAGLTGPQYPGHTSTSPGSNFNETLPGNGNVHYTLAGAPAQYDVACFQHFSHLP